MRDDILETIDKLARHYVEIAGENVDAETVYEEKFVGLALALGYVWNDEFGRWEQREFVRPCTVYERGDEE